MTGLSASAHGHRSLRSAAAKGDSTAWPRRRSGLLEPPMSSRRPRSWSEHHPSGCVPIAALRHRHGFRPVTDGPDGFNLRASFKVGALRQLRWLRALSLKKEHERTDRSHDEHTVLGPDQPSASVTGIMARRIAAR